VAECCGSSASVQGVSVLPQRFVRMIPAALVADNDADILLRPNDAMIQTHDVVLYTRLMEGRYPNWRNILDSQPKAKATVTVTAGALLSTLQLANACMDRPKKGEELQTAALQLRFSKAKLEVETRGAERGKGYAELAIDGPARELRIRYLPQLLLNFLRVLPAGEAITLGLVDGKTLIRFTVDDSYFYVAVPTVKSTEV
jgi:DNA polymerase III subunit beta